MAATMKDLARETGLGLATISSYFNGGNVRDKNRVKIEKAIKALNFEVNEVARGLKTNHTKLIGIVIPELNNIFCAEIITAVEDVLRTYGYAAIICDCRTDPDREKEAIDFHLHRRVDGLILMPTMKDGSALQRFISAGRPIVLIDRKLTGVDCDCVLVDNEKAVRKGVVRLIREGHRQIGLIAGPADIYTARERIRGYREALKAAGIPLRPQLISSGNYTINGGAKAMRRLLDDNPEMTAVFVTNYEMTMGAMIELNERHLRIPEDLSFIGYDNTEFARASNPKLAIVAQPTQEIGHRVAELILQRLAGRLPEQMKTLKLETSFIEGHSISGGSDEEILTRN